MESLASTNIVTIEHAIDRMLRYVHQLKGVTIDSVIHHPRIQHTVHGKDGCVSLFQSPSGDWGVWYAPYKHIYVFSSRAHADEYVQLASQHAQAQSN